MAFKRVVTQDPNLETIQSNVAQSFRDLETSLFQNGVLLSGVSLKASGVTAVPHKLGRNPQIWVLCDKNASSTVWKESSDSKFLNLRCSADCTVSVWVS